MTRPILDEQHLHPAIRTQVANYQHDILQEVQNAITTHKVTVVGMAHNPYCSRATSLLEKHHIPCHYLEYGNYFGKWKERGALKMWTGWPTFPMVFVDGVLIGGYNDLKKLIDSKELA